jgi:Tfp pilus assembly protein PilV
MIKMQHRLKQSNNQKSEKGFTLLETSIALMVMLIGGLGVVAVFAYAIKNNTGARDRAAAIAVAQQQLEQLRNLPFNDASLNATGTTVTPVTVESAGRSYVTPQNATSVWALGSVQITAQRASFALGPYTGGP